MKFIKMNYKQYIGRELLLYREALAQEWGSLTALDQKVGETYKIIDFKDHYECPSFQLGDGYWYPAICFKIDVEYEIY